MIQNNDPFAEFLRARQGRKVYLKPYWGNSGDELIWRGNELLLNELGLIRVLNPQKADIIMIPGGNPTMWSSPLSEWQDCWKRWPSAEFVIAPATFLGRDLPWKDLLKTTRANISGLFARDPESYRSLLSLDLPSGVQIGLGHDPALYLKNSKWVKDIREACTSEYILASFRSDHESAQSLPRANRLLQTWPLSSLFYRYRRRYHITYCRKRLEMVQRMANSTLLLVDQDASMMSFQSFIECISRASQVHTDRLHCMIISLLLGKETFAYPTAYGKLEGVYEHSIKSWAKVHFVRQV